MNGEPRCYWHSVGLVESDDGWSCPMCSRPPDVDQLQAELAAERAEVKRLRGIQRAVVALARSVLGESEHPVERSPWIDVIHMMDEEARTNGSAGATHVGAQP